MLITIAFIALLTAPLLLVFSARAQAITTTTYAAVTVNPNPVQVGKDATVDMWIWPYPPTRETSVHGFKLDITRPDGTTFSMGPYTAFLSSSAYTFFTPDQTGNYTIKFTYPGETYFNGAQEYLGSEMTITLEVQAEPLTPYPDYAPLPNDYWTFPVSAENRQWYDLTWPFLNQGGYLQNFNDWSPDVLAPHVMWKKPVDIGGVVGGPLGPTNYYEGSAYEAKSGTPIIIGNYLYITGYRIGQRTTDGTTCFDLYTGEEIWHMDDRISFAWMMQIDSGNMHAIIPYLVSTGSTYRFYDPKTGLELFEIEGAHTGTNYFTYNADSPMFKPNLSGTWPGTWFVWYVNSNADGQHGIQITLWNATKCFADNGWITYQVQPHVTDLAQWRPPDHPTSTNAGNWSLGIEWTGPISEPLYEYLRSTMPEDGNVTNQPKSYLSSAYADFESGVIVMRGSYFGEAFAGFSMTNGELLWAKKHERLKYCTSGTIFCGRQWEICSMELSAS